MIWSKNHCCTNKLGRRVWKPTLLFTINISMSHGFETTAVIIITASLRAKRSLLGSPPTVINIFTVGLAYPAADIVLAFSIALCVWLAVERFSTAGDSYNTRCNKKYAEIIIFCRRFSDGRTRHHYIRWWKKLPLWCALWSGGENHKMHHVPCRQW